jgi:hypothetical protein
MRRAEGQIIAIEFSTCLSNACSIGSEHQPYAEMATRVRKAKRNTSADIYVSEIFVRAINDDEENIEDTSSGGFDIDSEGSRLQLWSTVSRLWISSRVISARCAY